MSQTKRVLVFQHVDVEHPGVFRDFLQADGYHFDAIELDVGESIPALDNYAALWVMGGPMDVWEEDLHPWLRGEKAAIREAVMDRKLPYLGFCLGHQLLGDALGGECGLAAQSEVGILPVELNEAGTRHSFLAGVPSAIDVLQWHGAEVKRAPAQATVLAHSAACAIQAMAVGTHAFSMQFHVEITSSTVTDWAAIPEYADSLRRILGPDGAQALMNRAQREMPTFNAHARRIYDNWKRLSGFGT